MGRSSFLIVGPRTRGQARQDNCHPPEEETWHDSQPTKTFECFFYSATQRIVIGSIASLEAPYGCWRKLKDTICGFRVNCFAKGDIPRCCTNVVQTRNLWAGKGTSSLSICGVSQCPVAKRQLPCKNPKSETKKLRRHLPTGKSVKMKVHIVLRFA